MVASATSCGRKVCVEHERSEERKRKPRVERTNKKWIGEGEYEYEREMEDNVDAKRNEMGESEYECENRRAKDNCETVRVENEERKGTLRLRMLV